MNEYWSTNWGHALFVANIQADAHKTRYRVRAYRNRDTGQPGWLATPIR